MKKAHPPFVKEGDLQVMYLIRHGSVAQGSHLTPLAEAEEEMEAVEAPEEAEDHLKPQVEEIQKIEETAQS